MQVINAIRQGSRSPATILRHDFQSLVTDQQQQWLTQPQSPRLPTPASTLESQTRDSDTDFILYPSPTQRHSTLVPATALTDPNYLFASPYNGQVQLQGQTSTSTQRVGNIYGSSAISSNGLRSGLRASSASSPTIHRQRAYSRPPVPLFPNNSTGTVHQHQHNSELNLQGTLPISPKSKPALTKLDMDYVDWSRAGAEASVTDNLSASEEFTNVTLGRNNLFSANSSYDSFDNVSAYTVSPQDTMLDASSAPGSGVFSHLATPESACLESPNISYLNDSPFSRAMDINENWPSLFPESEENKPQVTTINPLQISSPTQLVAPEMSRTSSSGQTSSRSSHQGGRPSTSSGITKRRTQPLPDISLDHPDPVIAKRQRNTLAARKSRQRRVEQIEGLENEVSRLEMERDLWRTRAMELGHCGF